jgi:hypothetical protein
MNLKVIPLAQSQLQHSNRKTREAPSNSCHGLLWIGEDVLRAYLFSLIHTEPWQKLDAGFARKLQIYGEF